MANISVMNIKGQCFVKSFVSVKKRENKNFIKN